MASKEAFQNPFEEYSLDSAASVLNNTKDGLSGKFKKKLQNYNEGKLEILKTMKSDIFCNGTVYTGSVGLALYYFMNAIKTDDKQLYKKALDYLDVDNLKGRVISFLCGDAGPLALATVISHKLCKRPDTLLDSKTLAQRLMSLDSLLKTVPDEILYGKSGYLYALLFVNKYCNKDLIPASHIEKVVASIMNSGKKMSSRWKSESPLLWQWHGKIYYGAAHGMSGILYMLLQARSYIDHIELRGFVKPTIDWLLNQQFPSGNFPSSMESNSGDKLVQWCHGAPGFVALCVLAAEVFKEDKYMKIAIDSCNVIWQRGIRTKGYSLCHGVSGNAYAFIQLYQATKKPVHLYRACCFMEWCALERPGTELQRPDRPGSLFEGLVGRMYLAEDLTQVLNAKFPGFTL